MSNSKVLDRQLVSEYIQLHAVHAKAEKRLKVLKEELLPQLVAGAVSPPDLHALLVNRPQERPQPEWKGYCLTLLLKLYKRSKDAEAKAQADLDATDASWPKKENPALHVVLNSAYVEKSA